MKTSSPPLTEQLCNDFFRISGMPAGWAVHRKDVKMEAGIIFKNILLIEPLKLNFDPF